MAGVDRINEVILQEARENARARLILASNRADKIVEAGKREAAQKKKSILEASEIKAADIRRRILALAEIEMRKEKLNIRRQLVQEAFDKALELLCSMPEEEYCAWMARIILDTVSEEACKIVLSPKDREHMGNELLEHIGRQAAETGRDVHIELSDTTADICGGFIIQSEEVEMNYSFEAMMRAEQESLETIAYSHLELI